MSLHNNNRKISFKGIKKGALIAFMLLAIGVTSGFTPTTGENKSTIVAALYREFPNAEILQVKPNAEYTKVTFKMDGSQLSAYYSEKGVRLALARHIAATQLPMHLLLNLKAYIRDYWITDLLEVESVDDSGYYVVLENYDARIVIRSANNRWEKFKKEKRQSDDQQFKLVVTVPEP